MKVSLFIPCFMDQFYPDVGEAVCRVLRKLGHELDYPEGQTCCGQPAFNSGHMKQAACVAKRFLPHFDSADVVVAPSGSCAAMIKTFFKDLFGPEDQEAVRQLAEKTWEFSDFLVTKLGVTDVGARFPATVTYHDGCHGLREVGVYQQPRTLLNEVKDLTLIEMTEGQTCCGFGGTFAVKFPKISSSMAQVKTASAAETGAEYIVSGDSSCLMQIQGYVEKQKQTMKTIHLAEVLAST